MIEQGTYQENFKENNYICIVITPFVYEELPQFFMGSQPGCLPGHANRAVNVTDKTTDLSLPSP